MNSILILIISIFLFLGCNDKKTIQTSRDLEKYILDLPQVEVENNNVNIDREKVYSLLSRIDNSIPDKLFLIDYSDWSIYMAKKDGTLLDKKGGQGRGPGEFLGINDLRTYKNENVLQIFEKKLKRLTYYNIKEASFELDYTVNLPNYEQYYLQTVFKNNGKNVGVFRVLRQHRGAVENKIYLHYLDEEFNKKEKILETEGAELIEVERFEGSKRFEENMFGNETVWSYDDGKFVYGNAAELHFMVYNFDTDNFSEFRVSDIPENKNTSEITELWNKRYKRIFSLTPEYETYFKERKFLPYFNSIYANNDFLYIPLANYGNEIGYIIRLNKETEKLERIEVPSNFFMKGVNQSGIYGTITEDSFEGNIMVSIMEFK